MRNEVTVPQLVIIDDTNSPVQLLSLKENAYRIRKTLLMLLSIMFAFSLFYFIFVSLSCVSYTNSWLCQHFNHSYEYAWALVSIIYDGVWLLVTYRYYSKGLLFFAWLSTIFLFIFGIFLIIALLQIFRTMMYLHMIATNILIASISSMMICVVTSILQGMISLFSFKLAKLITKNKHSTV